MKRTISQFLMSVATVILTTIYVSGIAFAGNYTITPAKSAYDPSNSESRFGYYLSADPSDVLEYEVTIKNLEGTPVDVKVVPVDAFHDDGGAFILASPNAEQVGIGSWVEMEEQYFTLGPKQSLDIPFKINVPTQISPGTYFGGMMIGESAPPSEFKQSGTEVKSFVGVRMFLDVSGEEVVDFKWDKFGHHVEEEASIFTYKLSNNGNIMMKANVDLTINSLFGGEVFTHSTAQDAFPGKETEYSIKWDERPTFGFFTAKSVINYDKTDIFGKGTDEGKGGTLEKSTTFYIIPVLYLSIIGGILLLLILLIIWKIVSMKKFKAQLVPRKVKKGDTLFELAAKGNVSWKKLAKANKIKAPYVLVSGQTILVPKKK